MKRFIWLKEIYLAVVFEPIIDATINYTKKFFALIKATQCFPDFQRPVFSSYGNLLKQILDHFRNMDCIESFLILSFLSCLLFCLSKEVDNNKKGKFISRISYVSINEGII